MYEQGTAVMSARQAPLRKQRQTPRGGQRTPAKGTWTKVGQPASPHAVSHCGLWL